jgi:hypothetical protein
MVKWSFVEIFGPPRGDMDSDNLPPAVLSVNANFFGLVPLMTYSMGENKKSVYTP